MDYHQNARLTALGRGQMARMVLSTGCTFKAAAADSRSAQDRRQVGAPLSGAGRGGPCLAKIRSEGRYREQWIHSIKIIS